MVQLALTSLMGLLALSQSSLAAPQRNIGASDSGTCIANNKLYRSGRSYKLNGASYIVHCAKDSSGNSFSAQRVSSGGFSSCFEACERTKGCGGFSYSGSRESGNCYLKGSVGGYINSSDDLVSCERDPSGKGGEPEPVPASSVSGSGSGTGGSVKTSASASVSASASTSARASSSSSISASAAASSSSSVRASSSSSASAASSSTSSRASASSSSSAAPSSTSVRTSSASVTPSSASAPTSSSASTSAASSSGSSGSNFNAPIPTLSAVTECQKDIKEYGDVYRGGNGSAYHLSCSTDHYGGDLSGAGSSSFIGCVAICDATPDCIGYAYTPGICYLKRFLTTAQTSSGVDFAINLDRNATYKPQTSTSTSPSATSPTSTPIPSTGSCAYNAANGTKFYTDSSNIRYTIQCGTDHNGGDIGGAGAQDFVGCMDVCDKTDKCIGFAWTGGNGPGTCYLKGTVTGEGSSPDIDYAYKEAATYLPASSSSSTSASASKSESSAIASSSSSVASSTPVSSSSIASTSSSSSVSQSGVTTTTVTGSTPSATPSSSVASTSTSSSISKSGITTVTVTGSTASAAPSSTLSSATKKEHHTKSHHTKSHHTKSYDVESSTTQASLSSTTPKSGTASGSTVTEYISQSYTKTQWITSVSPSSASSTKSAAFTSSSASLTEPATPSSSAKPTKTGKTEPHKPAPEPLKPVPVGGPKNQEWCDKLRAQKPKKLRCEVVRGHRKFEGLWVKEPLRDDEHTFVGISSAIEEAASVAIHPFTSALHSWDKDEPDCAFRGLGMVKPIDNTHGHGGHRRSSEVFFGSEESSSDFGFNGNGLVWQDSRFEGWLVCDSDEGEPVLKFWAVASKAGSERREEKDCALVRLRPVE